MTERVLITGGAGFIGHHLAKYLATVGHEVCLVDNHLRGIYDGDLRKLLKERDVSFVELDLLNWDAVRTLGTEFDAIFHLAAIIGVQHVLDKPYDVLVQNTLMLDNVIKLCHRQKDLTRLFFASTSEVYAGTLKAFSLPIPTPEKAPLTVSELIEPRTSYMLSKIVGEAMIQNSSLPFTVFRPHNIYGPRMGLSHVIPEQLKNIFEADQDTSIEVWSPTHTRTFCFVDDAIEMLYRMLMSHSCQDQTLNLGVEAPEISVRQLVHTCIDISGKRLKTTDMISTPGSPARRAPDMRETTRLLKFEPRVTLEWGLEQTWNWYREHVFVSGGKSAK